MTIATCTRTEPRGAYFNGGLHGWNDARGYHPPERTTAVYCGGCAPAAIPLPDVGPDGRTGSRHWQTGFKWAPRYGAACHQCGEAC